MEFSDRRAGYFREFEFMGVLVENLDHLPEADGRKAFVEPTKCSIWLDDEPESDPAK